MLARRKALGELATNEHEELSFTAAVLLHPFFCLFVSHSFLSFLSFLSARERRKGSRTNPSRETSILAASIQL